MKSSLVTVFSLLVTIGMSPNSLAQKPDFKVEKAELATALSNYSQCNASCSAEVVGNVWDQGVDVSLAFVSALAATPTGRKAALAAWYVFARTTYQGAGKVVSSHGACANTCDAMYADIVTLGQAGVLGPLLKDGKVDEAALTNPKVLDAYLKHVKPVPSGKLPWQFHNQAWWDKISKTA